VDRETQRYGLATTLGFVSETGVAGLTLGGGVGYLTRRFGWTVDDLEAVEIVTADGVVREASRSENADLFWALRGGGGNFGVVTRFVFRLHQVGPKITGGLIAWSATEAQEVLELYRRVTENAPRELTVVAVSRNAPPAPWLAEEHHGKPMIAFVVCHSGDPEQAEKDLEPIRGFGTPWADIIGVKEYVAQQSMLDATHPKGLAYYWKSEYLDRISDEFIGTYIRQSDDNDSPANQIVLFHMGGALNEHAEDDGAVGNRDAAYICVVQGLWPADSDLGRDYRAWVRRAWSELKPFTTGGNYVNFHNADDDLERTRAAYGQNYARLARVKSAYDPQNLFRVNRNIPPAEFSDTSATLQHAG
jgi:FAD/FMN-containing dehydrogenase